ncbi:MAG: hypothetical protein JWO03_3764 [Bacteroidetes bacterium]|nr:hypothetical protein [Bacteroidota bacterium]
MKKLCPLLLTILLASCSPKAPPTPASVPAPAIVMQNPISADSVMRKFTDTPFKRDRAAQGATAYRDTTFRNDLFLVRDTISDIRVNNSDQAYFILGGKTTINGAISDVMCFLSDSTIMPALKVGQVITVSSERHYGSYHKVGDIKVFSCVMVNCKREK